MRRSTKLCRNLVNGRRSRHVQDGISVSADLPHQGVLSKVDMNAVGSADGCMMRGLRHPLDGLHNAAHEQKQLLAARETINYEPNFVVGS